MLAKVAVFVVLFVLAAFFAFQSGFLDTQFTSGMHRAWCAGENGIFLVVFPLVILEPTPTFLAVAAGACCWSMPLEHAVEACRLGTYADQYRKCTINLNRS